MSVARTDISEPGGIPAKPIYFAGTVIGHAATIREVARIAKAAGADVHPTNPHQGKHWAIDGRDRFIIEAKVTP